MPTTLADLTAAALSLTPAEREALADALYDSLDTGDEMSTDEADYDPEYVAELRRRLDDLRSGRVKGIPAAEVLRRMEADALNDPD